MFKIQELVNLINSGLNGVDENYSFNVYAEVGEEKNDGSINGILRTIGNDTTTIKGDSETRYTFIVEMPIISPRTNSNFLEIQQIVEQFASSYNGSQQEFSSGNGVLHINMGMPKQFNVSVNLGDNVPLAFTIELLYTESNITNADKHWLLSDDGEHFYEIPFENENVLVNKDGIVRKINNKNYTEAFLTGQTKYYKFVFPYQNTALGNMIQRDLLSKSGKFDKEYTLRYYDGASFTEQNPFETKVSIYSNGDAGTQKISVSKFNLTFADVDDGEYEWQYELALIDNRFDNQTEDTRWFNNQAEQQAYYEEKIENGCEFVTIKAPNLNSIDITSQVYPNNRGYNVFDLTNKNYAIIKATKEQPVEQVRYFYYFVTNAQIGDGGQVLFDLKLDTIQTYFFNDDIEFGDCLIERSCLNRFVDNGDNTVSFDGSVDSKLFAREKLQDVPKRLTKRTKLGACNTGDETFDNWINEHIDGWIYCYINPIGNMPIGYSRIDPNTQMIQENGSGKIQLRVGLVNVSKSGADIPNIIPVIAFPIFKKSDKYTSMYLEGTRNNVRFVFNIGNSFENRSNSPFYSFIYNTLGADNSGAQPDANPYIISVKYSTFCPFNEAPNYNIEDDNTQYTLKINANFGNSNIGNETLPTGWSSGQPTYAQETNHYYFLIDDSVNSNCAMLLTEQVSTYDLETYEIDKQLTFNINEIIGADKNPKFNPKLLSQDYFELQVCDETENGFAYDLQKLNKNEVQIGITEPLTSDNTKKYIRIINNDGIYAAETSENLLGFVNNNETTIALVTSQYSNMIAQNKNYFTQNSVNRDWGAISSLLGIGQSAAQGAIAGKFAGLSGSTGALITSAGQIISTIGNAAVNKMQEDLTIDNLKNAPGIIKQALGNCYFGSQYTEPGTYVEEYDILPAEKKVINDYMVQYGFSTNQIGQIRDYLNTNVVNGRKYFNYIQAVVNSISGISISNTARQDIRDRFAKGIRFWNDDNVDYDKENYEKWLEDDLTGTVWEFKDYPLSNGGTFNPYLYRIDFQSNNQTYNGISLGFSDLLPDETYSISYNQGILDITQVYRRPDWINSAYKTIKITGGSDINNATFKTWLKANATLIAIER